MQRSASVMRRNIKNASQPLTVLLIQGGSNLAIVKHATLWPTGLVIGIDVPNEIERVLPAPLPDHFYPFPLAPGHTAQTLAKNADARTREAISNLAAMNAAFGLGQWRGIGVLAMDRLLKSPEMKRFLNETLLDTLVQMSGGVLEHVQIIAKGGVSGGTASAAILQMARSLADAVTCRTGATVAVSVELIGPTSFVGLGPRVWKNAAAGVVDAVAYATEKDHHEREVRLLTLVELPPVGRDRATRDRLMLEVEQAKQCPEVRRILDTAAPNQALDTPFGNVKVWQVDHFHALDPRFDLAPDIAGPYADEIRKVASDVRPQTGLVTGVTLKEERADLPRASIVTIVACAQTSRPEQLIDAIVEPGFTSTVAIAASLRSGETLSLDDAATIWASPPNTSGEARRRLILQQSLLSTLDHEESVAKGRLEQLTREWAFLEQQVRKAAAALRPPSLLSRIRYATASPAQRVERLRSLATNLRNAVDRTHQVSAQIVGLQRARQQVANETEQLRASLERIAIRLDASVPHSERRRNNPLVIPKDIDQVYPVLCQLQGDVDDASLYHILVAAVSTVTLAGLAKITAAEPTRLDIVARHIADGSSLAAAGPPWGGQPRPLNGLRIHVIPPSAPEIAEKLQRLIHDRDSHCHVAVAEQMPASINCLTLHVHNVQDFGEDVLTKLLRRSLQDACEDPNNQMFFPFGLNALKQLGISINDHVRLAADVGGQEGVNHG